MTDAAERGGAPAAESTAEPKPKKRWWRRSFGKG
jgi:hypothetical protein